MCALVSAVAFAALSLARTARAQSSANCYVSVKAGGESSSHDAFVKKGFDLAVYLCDEYHEPAELSAYAEDWVSTTAEAYAKAYVESVIDCSVSGSGSASASLEGHAKASADATATAILEGYASASTCDGCDVYFNTFIESTKSVYVDAVASHYDAVDLYIENGYDSVYRDALVEDIKHEVIEVHVGYVVDLYASMTGNNGEDSSQYCFVNFEGCASTGESNCCNWSGDGSVYTEVENAYSSAIIEIPHEDINCYKVGDDTYYDFAKAVARAFASSYASVYGYCNNQNPDGNGCVWGSVSANAYATAAAEATASAWIAESYCGCNPPKDVMVKALETVYADAYSYISSEICVKGQAHANANAYTDAYEEKFGKATADVFASVWQDYYSCEITELTFKACAGTAAKNTNCYLPYFNSPKHCEGDDYHCVKVNDQKAVCKHVDYKPPGSWDGSIIECPEHED